jgi:hypothetical protein
MMSLFQLSPGRLVPEPATHDFRPRRRFSTFRGFGGFGSFCDRCGSVEPGTTEVCFPGFTSDCCVLIEVVAVMVCSSLAFSEHHVAP